LAKDWRRTLRHDPVAPPVASRNQALALKARRDLQDEDVDLRRIWTEDRAERLLRRQRPSGGWRYPGGNPKIRSGEDYDQIETFRSLGELVEKYAFTREHPAVEKACEFLLSHQTEEGDIRGILGHQYAPYYTAAMLELMIKAGYRDDSRVERGFSWLASMRQDDGGWALPLRTRDLKLNVIWMNKPTVEPLRSKPSSHLVTGMVLRAYAAHQVHRRSQVALDAARFLCSRILERDYYPDRGDPSFWTGFSYPFWFTDLVSATDSLSLLGLSRDEPKIVEGLAWLAERQGPDGTWDLRLLRGRDKDTRLWVSYAVARVFKRFYAG